MASGLPGSLTDAGPALSRSTMLGPIAGRLREMGLDTQPAALLARALAVET
jgi:hypothetical protein